MAVSPRRGMFILFYAFFAVSSLGLVLAQTPRAEDIRPFLDKVAEKIKAYPEYKNWKASTVLTITKMDRNWKPESVTVVTKNVKVTNGEREEEILKAVETKKGTSKDITQKYAEEARENREKEKNRRAEEKNDKTKDDESRGGSLSLGSLLPFSQKRRDQFDFRLNEGAALNGKPAVVFDVTAKIKDEKNWEGRFYFDPATYDLLQLEVKPSANPRMVKELEVGMTFDVLQGRYLVLKSSHIKINGGIFIKHIRQVVEEEYSGFEVLDEKHFQICNLHSEPEAALCPRTPGNQSRRFPPSEKPTGRSISSGPGARSIIRPIHSGPSPS